MPMSPRLPTRLHVVESIRRFDAKSYSGALESWGWLDGLAGMSPALANAFGDLFMTVSDFVVTVNIAGQIHEQIKDLPPGTKISGLTIE